MRLMSKNFLKFTKPINAGSENYTTDDQLKWRRERIEQLTRDLRYKQSQVLNLKRLYFNEVDFVILLRGCLKDVLDLTENKDSVEAKRLIETIDDHIDSQENFLNKINNGKIK